MFSDGSFCEWSDYSVCLNCVNGDGYQQRTRSCDCPSPANGGADCPASDSPDINVTTFNGTLMEKEKLMCSNCSVGML